MGTQLGEAFRIEMKVMARPQAFFLDQPGGFQHLQVLRHGGAADG